MSVSKEAIEAGLRITLSSVNMPSGECLHETDVREILEAALPFLPIAGEGKVKALEWREDQTDDGRQQWHSNDRECITVMGRAFADHERYWLFHAQKGFPSLQEAKAAAQADYETRILSALISSPGKDGGQEVGAVAWRPISSAPKDGTAIIGRTTQEEVFACNWFFDDEDEKEGAWLIYGTDEVRPREWIPMPDLRPQPASTALVERLTSALSKAEAVLSIYADPTGYADADGNQLEADAGEHEGLLAKEALEVVRSALSSSQSTSREEEARP